MPSEAWVPSYGPLKIKDKSVHPEFPRRHCRRQTSGPYFLPPCLTGAVYHSFLKNFLPLLLQDVDM